MKSLVQMLKPSNSSGKHEGAYSKKIECSCGKEYHVPGYTTDFICPDDHKLTEMDINTLSGGAWNWARNRTQAKKKISTTIKAVAKSNKDNIRGGQEDADLT